MRVFAPTLLALVLLASPWRSVVSAPVNLSEYLWRHRLLLIFATSSRAQGVESLRNAITRNKSEVADRDMLVFLVLEEGGSEVDGSPIGEDDAASLRRRFGVETGAALMLLVGKDGGEKLRAPLDEELSTVFGVIDGMPMRRREMQEQR